MLRQVSGVWLAGALVLLAGTPARAQSGEAQGPAGLALSPPAFAALTAPANFAITPLQEVSEKLRKHDSPWNGLLIGAALGAAIGFGTYTECTPVPPEKVCGQNLTSSRGMETAVAAALFGAVGLTLDLYLDADRHPQRASIPVRSGFSVGVGRADVHAQFQKRF